ncbi:MAG: prolipoprotein diacylglyceryl transferase [Verrucomicrobiota bacterium]
MSFVLATYVHHLDPFAIQFSESFGIRWYGLAYVAGFLIAFLLLRWFVSLGASELKKDQVADFITVVAVLGVMIGGRLGFMLLYNLDEFRSNPLSFFDFLGGGMASHGGIAGVCIASWIYAKKTKKSWTGLGDNLCVVAPVGVFFGRMANFVNGELYGRPTESSIAMKFPDELHEVRPAEGGGTEWAYPVTELRDLAEQSADAAPGLVEQIDLVTTQALADGRNSHFAVVELVKSVSVENEAFRSALGEILTPRHPSQLYEAFAEGLLLFLILLAIRLKWKDLYHGVLTGLFFISYAIGRITVESFREPDAERILGLTRGQFYSTFMILIGAAFLAYAFWAKRRNEVVG